MANPTRTAILTELLLGPHPDDAVQYLERMIETGLREELHDDLEAVDVSVLPELLANGLDGAVFVTTLHCWVDSCPDHPSLATLEKWSRHRRAKAKEAC